jgi:crossover junction endodeoxyribonuclease RuvC
LRIIGIDPGIALIGYAILDSVNRKIDLLECGVIKTSSDLTLPERLKIIREDLESLLERFKPEAAAVELIYFAKNVKTGIAVAHGRGIILEKLASFGIAKIQEFTPTHLKQVLFGSGKASKKEIQIMVSHSLGLEGLVKPDDAADAVALALAFIRGGFAV